MTKRNFALLIATTLLSSSAAAIEDFTFIHFTDGHIGPHLEMPEINDSLRGFAVTRSLATLGELEIEPLGIRSDAPSFFIHTGDITEFGFAGATEAVMDAHFEGIEPLYLIAGNHDNTWVTDTNFFRERHGGLNYTFDEKGIRFIGVNSATIQEPMPSLTRETILFVRDVLSQTPREMPIILFLHHPLRSGLASEYDRHRLYDELRNHNVVMSLVGHGHQPRVDILHGIPEVMAGSVFTKSPPPFVDGYNVMIVRDGVLHVVYRFLNAETEWRHLGSFPLFRNEPAPSVTITAPREGEIITRDSIRVRVPAPRGLTEPITARWVLNGAQDGSLTARRSEWRADIPAPTINGMNHLRITFTDGTGREVGRSVGFNVERRGLSDSPRLAWKRKLGAASQATPVLADGNLILGDNDGFLYGINQRTGVVRWKRSVGAEITRAVGASGDRIVAAAGDGSINAFSTAGHPLWVSYTDSRQGNIVGSFATPLIHGEVVYVGDNAARMHAFSMTDGRRLWSNRDADFSIENAPIIAGDLLVYTAWDGFIYALNKNTGQLVWKTPNWRNRGRVVRYYGAADNRPQLLGDFIAVADRGYHAGLWDLQGNPVRGLGEDAAALAASFDGRHVIIRGQAGPVEKRAIDGSLVWTSSVIAGRLPVEPTVTPEAVYLTTNSGTLHALHPNTGETLWRYQASPQLYILGSVAVSEEFVYTVDLDGNLLAIRKPTRR